MGDSIDAAEPGEDAAVIPSSCGAPDDGTSAQFSFESLGASVDDDTNSHTASFVGGMGSAVPGPAGCGMAVQFPPGGYAEIPDAPAWDLGEGSIDFWVNPADNGMGSYYGLVSRDAGGTPEPGHFALYHADTGMIIIRIQDQGTTFLCSDNVIDFGQWAHVGVNFGAPRAELWVDGVLASIVRTETFNPPGGSPQADTCNPPTAAVGIAGNSEPWVLGAGNILSRTGQATPIMDSMSGAIDNFRVSAVRRDFSTP